MDISKRNYGQYSSSNYGAHSIQTRIGNVTLWFSYNTVVAFSDGYGRKVCENVWGAITGKHLDWIDGGNKKSRISSEEFDKQLKWMLEVHSLTV